MQINDLTRKFYYDIFKYKTKRKQLLDGCYSVCSCQTEFTFLNKYKL